MISNENDEERKAINVNKYKLFLGFSFWRNFEIEESFHFEPDHIDKLNRAINHLLPTFQKRNIKFRHNHLLYLKELWYNDLVNNQKKQIPLDLIILCKIFRKSLFFPVE